MEKQTDEIEGPWPWIALGFAIACGLVAVAGFAWLLWAAINWRLNF